MEVSLRSSLRRSGQPVPLPTVALCLVLLSALAGCAEPITSRPITWDLTQPLSAADAGLPAGETTRAIGGRGGSIVTTLRLPGGDLLRLDADRISLRLEPGRNEIVVVENPPTVDAARARLRALAPRLGLDALSFDQWADQAAATEESQDPLALPALLYQEGAPRDYLAVEVGARYQPPGGPPTLIVSLTWP
jgi:hypothetical protein